MKRYKYDVYESDGTYITTWSDVISEPSFSKNINGGLGECKIVLARLADDFGESDDVTFNNQVIIRCFDTDTNDGVIVFNGFISGYTPVLEKNDEYIEVNVLGYVQELSGVELLDNGTGINETPTLNNTTVEYASQDPSDILKDVIDKYNDITGVYGKINYAVDSIDDTSLSVSYIFKSVSILEAIEKIVAMCPANWYWYLDENNIIHLHQFSITSEHTFYVGRDIQEIKPYKRIENVKNVCYVTGGDNSGENHFRKYDRSASITAYGRKVIWIEDNRLTDADTMQAFADAVLDRQDEPEVRTQITIVDNNTAEKIRDTSLIAHYKFDEGSGTEAVDSQNGLNGTITGATYVGGKDGYALSFNGTSDKVVVAYDDKLAPTEELSFGCWAYRSNWTEATARSIISKTESGGYLLQCVSGYIRGFIFLNGAYKNPQYALANLSVGWHHFFVTCDGRYSKLYVDGALQSTVDAGATYPIYYKYENAMGIGIEATSGDTPSGSYFDGKIDEVKIYNKALTQNEITEIFEDDFIEGNGMGYDIESIHPGDTVNVLNFLSKKTYTQWGSAIWGTDVWGYDIANVTAVSVNIIKVDYIPDYIKIEVSSMLPTITRGINELRRRLESQATVNNPDAPT